MLDEYTKAIRRVCSELLVKHHQAVLHLSCLKVDNMYKDFLSVIIHLQEIVVLRICANLSHVIPRW